MAKSTEEQPEAVPARATRAGDILLRWNWVEPRIWTPRMLTALEQGVKGGKWFSLSTRFIPNAHCGLRSPSCRHKGAAGVDHVTVTIIDDRLENLKRLSEDLQSGLYPPQQIRRHYIPNRGVRKSSRWEFRRCATGWCKRRC